MASTVGSVFVRSMHVADEVHEAMLARGYRGEPPVAVPFAATRRDAGFVGAAGVVLILIWTIGRGGIGG